MRHYSLLCMTFICVSMTLNAATHLSDDVGGKTLDPSGNPYIIDQDIVIQKNTQLVLKAGCVFLFKSFTGINVYGSMIVEGTSENTVVFTSINDANYNPDAVQLPNAFDWNGIYIAENSGDVKFRNFKLMYSVFGIKSKKDQVTIQSGYFKQNGQFHFTINDNIHYVQDNISYSYNVPETNNDVNASQQTKQPEPDRTRSKSKTDEANKGRKVAAVTMLSVGVASGVTCLITGIMTAKYNNQMSEISDLADSTVSNPDSLDKEWNEANDKYNRTKPICIITGIVTGVTIPISLFLFVKKDKSTMTKKVSLDFKAGLHQVEAGFSTYF